MKPLLIFTALLVSTSFSLADPELDRLKESYEGAVQKALAPLNATYTAELQKLLQRYAQEGKVEAVALVVAELKNLEPAVATAAAANSQAPALSVKDFIVGTSWKTPTGTLFSFHESGKGLRSYNGRDETKFTWRRRSKDLIEVTGDDSIGGRETTWYFEFSSDTVAHYGNNRKDLTTKVTKQD